MYSCLHNFILQGLYKSGQLKFKDFSRTFQGLKCNFQGPWLIKMEEFCVWVYMCYRPVWLYGHMDGQTKKKIFWLSYQWFHHVGPASSESLCCLEDVYLVIHLDLLHHIPQGTEHPTTSYPISATINTGSFSIENCTALRYLISNWGIHLIPRGPNPDFLVNLTWDAVKGCLIGINVFRAPP